MNIFASVKPKELEGVMQIGLTDESSLRKIIEERFGKVNGRLYDWFKNDPKFKVFPFTTTMGDYDPDYLNWYCVIDKEAGVLTIVDRR